MEDGSHPHNEHHAHQTFAQGRHHQRGNQCGQQPVLPNGLHTLDQVTQECSPCFSGLCRGPLRTERRPKHESRHGGGCHETPGIDERDQGETARGGRQSAEGRADEARQVPAHGNQ